MRVFFFLFVVLLSSAAYGQLSSVTIQVSGLTCAMCSKAVEKSLGAVAFVNEVKTNLKTQEYLVTFKENHTADFEALKKAIEDAGFSVARFQISGNFENVQVKKAVPVFWNNQYYYFLNADNATLNGVKTITIVERDFLSAKTLKKYYPEVKLAGVESTKKAITERVYRVVL